MPVKYRTEMAGWAESILKERGLTLRMAEIATGVSYTTINNIVKGRVPEPTILIRFAAGMGQDVAGALRLAGLDDIAQMWESGRYPREAIEVEPAEDGAEAQRARREIGRRIRLRMEALDINQPELGKLIGRTQGTVSGYLSGRVGLDVGDLKRIAKALGITVTALLGEEELDQDADGNRPRLIAFYDDCTPEGREDLLAIAETVWKRKRREDPVHGRKAE